MLLQGGVEQLSSPHPSRKEEKVTGLHFNSNVSTSRQGDFSLLAMKHGTGLPEEEVRQTFLEKDKWPCPGVKINSECPAQPYHSDLANIFKKKS